MESVTYSEAINQSFFKDENNLSLIEDMAEFGVENLINSPLKDLPIIRYFIDVAKFGSSTRDFLLMRKIISFLNGLKGIENDKKNKFLEKLKNDRKYAREIGENLIVILDRFDHLTKAIILSKLFGAYIENRISYNHFLRLSVSVERTFIEDLLNLNQYYNKNLEELTQTTSQNLYQSGLISISFNRIFLTNSEQVPQQSANFIRNELGTIYCRIIFNRIPKSNLIIPSFDDFECYIFELICREEDVNHDYFDYKEYMDQLIDNLKIDDEEIRYILNKFESQGLIENCQKVITGDYIRLRTSFTGYDFYFQQLEKKNEFIHLTIKNLIDNKLKETSLFAKENKISKRRLEHLLIILENKRLIRLTEHSHGYLINQIESKELEKYLTSLE